MKKYLYLTLCGVIAAGSLLAQTTSSAPQNTIVPPSPTASSLGKYAEWPVSLYTGTPDISVPLYTISSKGVSLPISLSYHASGIKVEEDASWVGLGWALNSGGVITRTVRGLPDDEAGVGYFASRTLLRDPWNGYSDMTHFGYFFQEAIGAVDTQPDVYMFNALGHSFKFFIDSNYNVQTIPKSTVKIIPSGIVPAYSNPQWEAILEDGTKLYFGGTGATEKIDNTDGDGVYAGSGYESSWFLKKIVPVSGPEINFAYTPEYTTRDNLTSMTDYVRTAGEMAKAGEQHLSHSTIYGIRLTSISSANVLVNLVPHATQRSDIPSAFALDSVTVYALPSNRVIKKIALNASYSASNRLHLDSLTEVSANNANKIRQWKFTYNTLALPARGSYAQDHWGYYNGAVGNATLLPEIPNPSADNSPYNTGDREAHASYSAAEILTRIDYPTGGYSAFTYEPHSYLDWTTTDTSATATTVLQTTDPMGTKKTVPFTIGESQDVTIGYTYVKDPSTTDPLYAVIKVTDSLSTITYYTKYTGANGTFSDVVSLSPGRYFLSVVSNDMDNTYCSVSATYTTTSAPHQVSRIVGGVRVKGISAFDGLSTTLKKNYVYENAYCAAPIKNENYAYPVDVSHHDPCGVPDANSDPSIIYVNEKLHYIARSSYTKAALGSTGGSHIGYGKVTVVYGDSGENGTEENNFNNDPADANSYSFPFPPVTSFDYKRGLLLNQKTTDANSHTRKSSTYTYTFVPNYTQSAYAVAFQYYDYCYPVSAGLISMSTQQIVYASFSTTSEWMQKTSEQNDIYDDAGHIMSTVSNFYYDNPTHLQLTRTVSTKSDGKTIASLTTYPDDYASGTPFIDSLKSNHQIVPIEQVSYQADGTTTTVLGGSATQYQAGGKALVDKVFKLETSIPIATSAFKFSNATTGNMPYSSTHTAYSPDSHYVEKLNYNLYDNIGNPLTLTPSGGESTSYQWAYNQQYPVAECKNALSTEFFYEGFEENTSSSVHAGAAHTGTHYYNGSYITSDKLSPGLHGRTYIISYWHLSGSTWLYSGELPYTGQTLTGYLDDIRIYPNDAQLNTYTYLPLTGMTSSTDAKGQTSYYEYDSFQRLINVRDQYGNILKHTDYHYAGQ